MLLGVNGTATPLPLAPVLSYPPPATSMELANSVTFSWVYNSNNTTAVMTGYAFQRINTATNVIQYWSASSQTWQSTKVWNSITGTPIGPGQTFNLTFPAGFWSDGVTYTWTAAVQNSNGYSPFAVPYTVTGVATPLVTIVAPSGFVATATPVINWTVTTTDGSTQVNYRVIIYTSTVVHGANFVIGSSPSVYDTGVVAGPANTLQLETIPVYLPTNMTYYVYIQVTVSSHAISAWTVATFTVNYTPPNPPSMGLETGNDPNTGYPLLNVLVSSRDNILSALDATPVGPFVGGNPSWAAINSESQLLYPSADNYQMMLSPYQSAYESLVMSLSPQGFWKCDDSASTNELVDSSGNGYTLTPAIASGGSITYQVASSPVTDGTDAVSVQVANAGFINSTLALPTTAVTLAGWVNIPSVPTVYAGLFGWRMNPNVGSTDANCYILIDTGSGALEFRLATVNVTITLNPMMIYGQWTHLAMTYNGSEVVVYINGVAQQSAAATGDLVAYSGFGVGALYTSSGVQYYTQHASISEVAFWDTALTATQIADLANACITLQADTAPSPSVPFFGQEYFLYTAMASFQSTNLPGQAQVGIIWYNSAYAALGPATFGNPVTTLSTGLTQATYEAQVPADATYAALVVQIAATSPHYILNPGIMPGNAPWGPGGLVPIEQCVITRSDGLYVRGASQNNPLAFYNSQSSIHTGALIVSDYECVPTVSYTYTAVTIAVLGVNQVLISAPSVVSPALEVQTTSWWEVDPNNTPSAVNGQFISWNPVNVEQLSPHMVTGQPVLNMVANVVMNQDFNGTVELFNQTDYVNFQALLTSQKVLFIQSPWGTTDSGYFRIGPEPGGMTSGNGTTNKSTTLLPSNVQGAHRTVAITAVAQVRPPV